MGESAAPTSFTDYKECISIIQSIGDGKATKIDIELHQERFREMLDEYQEQPHLLDGHLESMVLASLEVACKAEKNRRDLVFKLLYGIIKTRGFKVVIRTFPHEVKDVSPVLKLLISQDPDDTANWETHYCLLLWLSVVSMIPFDMSRLDAGEGEGTMQQILGLGKTYCVKFGKYSDAASYLLAKFLTRPDVVALRLDDTLNWALDIITGSDMSTLWNASAAAAVNGALRMLSQLFKFGKREDLLTIAPKVMSTLAASGLIESKNTVLRKLHVKTIQRIGLTFLKSKPASWRYQRGSRSLLKNLGGSAEDPSVSAPPDGLSTDAEEEEAPPDEIAEIIGLLLEGLKDHDTIVRWSAAKGVGRVTGRLTKATADEVVDALLELFTDSETDTAWHGGCLCLAELGRRGLLLPSKLADVVPVVMKALVFDEKRGNFSVGAHVRDAASYVCWAFARAYDPEELLPYVTEIANALVIVSVFDREVNVRRAASAAFQENVGRQGTFPHGIDILTMCDYFAVGNLQKCYSELCVGVAQYEEYRVALLDHLHIHKVNHWNCNIRELTSQSFYNLAPSAPTYAWKKILPAILSKCASIDLYTRHGSMLCVGQLCLSLTKCLPKEGSLSPLWTEEIVEGIAAILPKLRASNLFLGVSGDLTKMAFCQMISDLALSKCPLHDDMVLMESWQEMLALCSESVTVEVQELAAKAKPFYKEYCTGEPGSPQALLQVKVIDKCLLELKARNLTHRSGYTLALGYLPVEFIRGRFQTLLAALAHAAVVKPGEEQLAEVRKIAIESITRLCSTAGIAATMDDGVCEDNISLIYSAILQGMTDYSLDSRGDIGAGVRESSMSGLLDVTLLVMKNSQSLLTADIVEKMFTSVIQQSCEKIDRTRNHAGEVFSQLLHHEPPIPSIPDREALLTVFSPSAVQWLNWGAPKKTFPLFVQLLRLPVYRYNTLLGFIVSVGGMTESLVRESYLALKAHLRAPTYSSDPVVMQHFCDIIMDIFESYKHNDRVILPLLKMLNKLLLDGFFEDTMEYELPEGKDSFPLRLVKSMKAEVARCANPQKLMSAADVFCQLVVFQGEVKKKALTQLMVYLCHRYPKIRKTSAEQLHEVLALADSESYDPEVLDSILTALSDTVWDVDKVSEIRPIRDEICRNLGIPCPVLVKK